MRQNQLQETPYQVRLLHTNEIDTLYLLNQRVAYDPASRHLLRPRSVDYLMKCLDPRTGFTVGAFHQEALIGYRAVHYTAKALHEIPHQLVAKEQYSKVVYFAGITVLPEYQGQGLASRMLKETLNMLKSKGFRYVTVGCNFTNQASIRLLMKHGFKTVYLGKPAEVCYKVCYLLNDLLEKAKPAEVPASTVFQDQTNTL